jgi:hypothetical protein
VAAARASAGPVTAVEAGEPEDQEALGW